MITLILCVWIGALYGLVFGWHEAAHAGLGIGPLGLVGGITLGGLLGWGEWALGRDHLSYALLVLGAVVALTAWVLDRY